MLGKSKIFVALAFIFTLIFSVASFSPSVANAQTFTLKNIGSVQKFAIEGKIGGLFKKGMSFSVNVTGGGGNAEVMIYTDTTYRYRGIDIAPYIAGTTGRSIIKGGSKSFNFKGKGNIFITLGIQRARGNNVTVDINVPSGFSVRQL